MYRDFYQFKYLPFDVKPAPQDLFVSPSHQTALGPIIRGIRERQGFLALLGEAGLGKATLLQTYLEQSDQQQLKVLYVSNANISFEVLIKSIYKGLECELVPKNISEILYVVHLHTIFIKEYEKGFNIVLIIDNAHEMPYETLRKLPLLIEIEPYEVSLIQIVLIGQPILEQNLDYPALRVFKNKVKIISYMHPLDRKDSIKYIESRLIKASKQEKSVISKRAIKEIAKHSKGIPRNLDTISTDVLIYGYQSQKNPISARIARRVIADFAGRRTSAFLRFAWLGMVGMILLGSLAGVFLRDHWPLWSAKMFAVTRPEQPVPTSVEKRAVAEEAIVVPPAAPTVEEEAFVAIPQPAAIVPSPVKVIQQVTALVHQFFPDGGAFALQVQPDKGMDAVYTAGEKLLVDIVAASDVYLQVDYYQADGQVVHLLPNSLDTNYVEAGETFTLGKPESSFQFAISPPFGVEMLTVIASHQPLGAQVDVPSVEPASIYLERLAKSLERYQADETVAVAYTRIRTQELLDTR